MALRHVSGALCLGALLTGAIPVSAQSRDSSFEAGAVKYRRIDKGAKGSERNGKVTWSKDGRYRHDLKQLTEDGKPIQRSFVYHPQWRYVETKIGEIVEVSFDDSGTWPLDDNRRFFITAGPSRPLAGQLSDEDLKLFEVGENGIPKRAERFIDGQVVNRWKYSGELNAGPIAVPKVARYEVPGDDDRRREFYIESATLGQNPPENELVTEWFAPKKTVIDRRVDPVVTWTYEDLKQALNGRTVTPELLLELSRKRSAGFAKEDQRKVSVAARHQQGQDQRMGVLLGILGTGGALGMVTYGISRRRRKP